MGPPGTPILAGGAVPAAELERCIRDLLALLALPDRWCDRDPRALVEILFDALGERLHLDFAYACLRTSGDEIEVCRIGAAGPAVDELRRALQPHLWRPAPVTVSIACGRARYQVAISVLGGPPEVGTVVLGSRRAGFPSSSEQVLLAAGTSLAGTGIETARVMREREEALRAKDEFLAMLGHELRNPLAPIITALQLMKLRGDLRTSREQEIIERQARHLVRLVDDLLDISRVTRGKVALDRSVVDVNRVVAKAVETASPLLEQKAHHLSVEVPRGLRIDGDSVRLAQVVANLVTNAAKYTPVGGHISVDARRDGREVKLRVRDDGMGIAPELLPRVFDQFVQGQTTIDRSEGGLGLGLALVRNLVTLHGGSVSAHSAGVGKGSEFLVQLPALPERGGEAGDSLPGVTRLPCAQPRRVIVTDDNADAAELLAEVLRAAGHEVAVVHDAPGALGLLERFHPDVMVLDIGLPIIDGYELAGRIRAELGEKSPRLVAVTGYGQEHDRARSALAGFAVHLVKPVDASDLVRAVAAG